MASPATTSRCGMVYMNPAELGWMPHVETWMQLHLNPLTSDSGSEFLHSLFSTYGQKGLDFVHKECSMLVQTVEINLTTALCDLFLAIVLYVGLYASAIPPPPLTARRCHPPYDP